MVFVWWIMNISPNLLNFSHQTFPLYSTHFHLIYSLLFHLIYSLLFHLIYSLLFTNNRWLLFLINVKFLYIAHFSAVALLKITVRKHVNSREHKLNSTKFSQPQKFSSKLYVNTSSIHTTFHYKWPMNLYGIPNDGVFLKYQPFSLWKLLDCLNQECACQVYKAYVSHAVAYLDFKS